MSAQYPETCLQDAELTRILNEHGINPTYQRVSIARALLGQQQHVSAEEVFRTVNRKSPTVSKATVYNTLGLFAKKGVIREVIADPERVFYDTNVTPHHHIYDETTGELRDVDVSEVNVTSLPALPVGTEIAGVDVIVRVRRTEKN